jgi:hypothetical protein
MPAVTVQLPKALHSRLRVEAARRRKTEAAVLRESFEKMAGLKTLTLWDRIGHLAGTIDGPGNLSTLSKSLPGYGRSRSR